ncbi:MAG: patatin-like phospholipase family protein [Simkaniaceae bacterium]|nr:MAG: patatin-like phospholipase family protein [Simkaniaceae bacterium]
MKLSQAEPEPIPQFVVPQEHIKVALVLGGGGSKGLAHVGVIKELEQAGIYPDLIVGCSSGAVIGALYADQPHVKRLEKLLIGLKRSDLMDISIFASKFGVVKGILFKSFLEENLKARKFRHLQIPFIAVATDLKTGELVEFGGGEIISPIMASSAVPGVFNPVYYKGRYLVDGGVADPIPVRVAKKYGAHIIIAVDVGEDLNDREPSHFFGVARRSLEISHRKLSEYVTRDADVVIRMNFQGLGMFSDSYNQEIYDHGRKMARLMIPHIEKIIQERLPIIQEECFPSWVDTE